MELSGVSDLPNTNSSSNVNSNEIDDDTAKKLRGDAIGDTMYSEVFVLNTLLQFSDLQWNSEVEDNLCFLWDMTEEKDVCQYLFQVSYPTLACSAIEKYSEPRFLEIVVGIFTNLLCSQCEKNVNVEHVKSVLKVLHSNDPYILIQVMRFIHAVSFMYDKMEFIEEEHLDRFDFILCGSTNKELLTASLKTLASVTENNKISGDIIKGQLLMSAVTACRTLKEDCEFEDEQLDLPEKQINVKHLIQFLCNVCSYIDILNLNRLGDELKLHLSEFTSEVVILLNYYSSENNLLPIDERFTYYLEALTYIYKVLNVGYVSPVAKILFEIFYTVYRKDISNLEHIAELFCYFISAGSLEVFQKDFENVQPASIKEVLSFIDKKCYNFEFEYNTNLKQILAEL